MLCAFSSSETFIFNHEVVPQVRWKTKKIVDELGRGIFIVVVWEFLVEWGSFVSKNYQ